MIHDPDPATSPSTAPPAPAAEASPDEPAATASTRKYQAKASKDRIVWIDCEMTGLDLTRDALVEVAALVTDYDLNVLGEGIDVVIRPADPAALEGMNDFVRQMHTTSGLLDEIPHGVSAAEAEALVLDYVRAWVPEPRKALLGGNSIGTDKGFLQQEMPALIDHLHYRVIDVSTVKELSRHWYPRAYFQSPRKATNHRALADIEESIEELRYYRRAVFVPQPGPTSDEARAITKALADAPDAPA